MHADLKHAQAIVTQAQAVRMLTVLERDAALPAELRVRAMAGRKRSWDRKAVGLLIAATVRWTKKGDFGDLAKVLLREHEKVLRLVE